MRDVAKLLNDMRATGVIAEYALFGAVAQMRYTEAVATFDADMLVTFTSTDRIDLLTPIYDFCKNRGYAAEGEAVKVGIWPVQFIPVFSQLTLEPLQEAETVDFDGVPLRVVRAEHPALIALSVGRAKDYARLLALLESAAVTRDQIASLAQRHEIHEAWMRFEKRFLHD